MMRLALDVETIGPADQGDNIVPALQRPVSVALWSEKNTGLVLLASDGIEQGHDTPVETVNWSKSEAAVEACTNVRGMLVALADRIFTTRGKPREVQLVTFNGRTFDLPVLIYAYMAAGIEVPLALQQAMTQKRWERKHHVDLRDLLGFDGAVSRGTLGDYARAFGFDNPKECGSGGRVAEFVEKRQWSALGIYNMADALTTARLFRMCQAFLRL